MLEIGNGGMNENEYRMHMSLWSMLAAPLIAGNDLRTMTQAIKDILMNREVIAIDQDPAGKQARRVSPEGEQEIWVRELAGGAHAVALFNKAAEPAKMTSSGRTWGQRNAQGRAGSVVALGRECFRRRVDDGDPRARCSDVAGG